MRSIPMNKGYFALVDDEDYALLSRHKWNAVSGSRTHTVYAKTQIRDAKTGKWKTTSMHSIIFPHDRETTDHIDGNGLNNQKSNLRVASYTQNSANKRIQKHSTAYKGVYYSKSRNRYQVGIGGNKTRKHVGTCDCPIKAAEAYDEAAIQRWGSFARTNKQMGLI